MAQYPSISECQHIPKITDQETTQLSIKTDEGYLLELQHQLDCHRTSATQSELSIKEIKSQIEHHTSFLAPDRRLPTEVIGRVFSLVDYEPYGRFHTRPPKKTKPRIDESSYVTPNDWLRRTPYNVCCVSRGWRMIALSTPRLWTWLIVDTQKKSPDLMMLHWFQYAKVVPVHVTIWHEELWGGDGEGGLVERTPGDNVVETIVKSITEVISSHSHQVASLRVCCESEMDPLAPRKKDTKDMLIIFEALSKIDGSISHSIEGLTIDSMDICLSRTKGSSLLPRFPIEVTRLKSLHIRGFILARHHLSVNVHNNLTTLKLDAPSSPGTHERHQPGLYLDLIKCLSCQPQLERLRLKGKYAPLSSSDTMLTHTGHDHLVHLPRLIKLTLVGYSCATYASRLLARNLKTLKLQGECYRGPMTESEEATLVHWDGMGPIVSRLLERCEGSLTKLSLIGLGRSLDRNTLASWLKSTNDLRHLTLVQSLELLGATAEILSIRDKAQENWVFCTGLASLEWRAEGLYQIVDWGPLESRKVEVNYRSKAGCHCVTHQASYKAF